MSGRMFRSGWGLMSPRHLVNKWQSCRGFLGQDGVGYLCCSLHVLSDMDVDDYHCKAEDLWWMKEGWWGGVWGGTHMHAHADTHIHTTEGGWGERERQTNRQTDWQTETYTYIVLVMHQASNPNVKIGGVGTADEWAEIDVCKKFRIEK